MKRFPDYHFTSGHFFKGARNSRTLGKVSFIELVDEDTRNNLLAKIGESAVIGGGSVKIKKALSKINESRNYALRKAEELLKSDPQTGQKQVVISWSKPRGVKVDGTFAFSQNDSELTGTFAAPYNNLQL